MAFISEKTTGLMNYRIEQEELSSRIYKAMSVWLDYNGFPGAAKLWAKYSEEEAAHAEIAYKYLLDLDVMPEVPPLEKPQTEFNGLPDIIRLSYNHELDVTEQCNKLARTAFEEGDFMTLQLAQWYLKEQTEEIAKTKGWVDKLNAFGQSKEALRLLDNEMAELIND